MYATFCGPMTIRQIAASQTSTSTIITALMIILPSMELVAISPLWVKSRHLHCNRPCPLYPQKRTCAVQLGMSAMGQKRHGSFSMLLNDLRIGTLPITPARDPVLAKAGLQAACFQSRALSHHLPSQFRDGLPSKNERF